MSRFQRMFPGFSLRLTRWGAGFLLGLVVTGAAAVNTGNNALIGVVSVALASYLVAGVWSREVLRQVHLEVEPPHEAFAGRPVQVTMVLENRSRIFPAYGVVVRDEEGEVIVRQVYLPARGQARVSVTTAFERRGWNEVGPWRLEVSLPLAFFVKSKDAAPAHRILVYPALGPIRKPSWLTSGVQRGQPTQQRRGREGEVLQLRFYRDGDEAQQVHWKQTARQQRLIVVDREAPESAAPVLVIEPRQRSPGSASVREMFERSLSEATSVIVHRLQRGQGVGLMIGDELIAPVASRLLWSRLLRPLAEVELRPSVETGKSR